MKTKILFLAVIASLMHITTFYTTLYKLVNLIDWILVSIFSPVTASAMVFISFDYKSGIKNLVINGDSNNSFKNKYFGLRLGYTQGKKKLL